MQTSATGTHNDAERARGFTLLELILAVALMGLAVSLVVLSVAGFADPRPIDEAHSIADRIALIHEESGFTGRIIGLRLRDDPARDGDETLEFLELMLAADQKLPQWVLADPRDQLLAPAPVGERLRVTLEVDAAAARAPGGSPSVLLLPDGELTPFVLSFSARLGGEQAARLTALEDGTLTVTAVR